MDIKQFIKPAVLTAVGLLIVSTVGIFNAPPSVEKAGWALIALGSVWFLMRTK